MSVRCAAALRLLSVELACGLCLSSAFVMCLLLSALCHMPLALCCPVRFYLLFVSGICFVFVAWFEHVLLPSCIICCYLCPLPLVTCLVWACGVLPSFFLSCPPLSALCVVMWGVAFALPQTPVCVHMCCFSDLLSAALCFFCCHLLPSAAIWRLALCLLFFALYLLPSALHYLPSAFCHLLTS